MAEDSAAVPRELLESIKDVIGRKIKISVKKKVKLEVKGDKVENKVLDVPVALWRHYVSWVPVSDMSPCAGESMACPALHAFAETVAALLSVRPGFSTHETEAPSAGCWARRLHFLM